MTLPAEDASLAGDDATSPTQAATFPVGDAFEWLEADGLGGFAHGTSSGVRTRRYHATLLVATRPPTGRVVLVNGFDAWVETPDGRFALSSQAYASGALGPDGVQRIRSFELAPWPRWEFELEGGVRVAQELFVPKGREACVLAWRLLERRAKSRKVCRLILRPFLSGRDYHGLHIENLVLRFDAKVAGERVEWRTYGSLPAVALLANGEYRHEPHWYRSFSYAADRARGQDHVEDLASPGEVSFDLSGGEAVAVFATAAELDRLGRKASTAVGCARALRTAEASRRARFADPFERAADAFIAARGEGRTILAGYPWFTDWGRDTFIAMRGLCIATGRLDEARAILLEWAEAVSEGMLPNRFTDRGETPDYNSVDASLWFVVVVGELLAACSKARVRVPAKQRAALEHAALSVIEGYARGTRYGIRMDDDGLIAAGVPGVQLTWMDAKVGDLVVTPRIGKPVEVQALWINALATVGRFTRDWRKTFDLAVTSFSARFWNEAEGALFDVVDVDHVPGAFDASLRPNQVFAIGGLPLAVLTGDRAAAVVERVERELWTPLGLRTLAPSDPRYRGAYVGGLLERDQAYHQGTVWPWLAGPFIEAWIRARGNTAQARREAKVRFHAPLERLASSRGGHLPEIADGDAPHAPRGSPFQAWSLGEMLRIGRVVLDAS